MFVQKEGQEMKYKVRTTNIDYYIGWEDLETMGFDVENMTDERIGKEIERINNDLPKHLKFEFECDSKEDLDDLLVDAISEQTGWLISSVDYTFKEAQNRWKHRT